MKIDLFCKRVAFFAVLFFVVPCVPGVCAADSVASGQAEPARPRSETLILTLQRTVCNPDEAIQQSFNDRSEAEFHHNLADAWAKGNCNTRLNESLAWVHSEPNQPEAYVQVAVSRMVLAIPQNDWRGFTDAISNLDKAQSLLQINRNNTYLAEVLLLRAFAKLKFVATAPEPAFPPIFIRNHNNKGTRAREAFNDVSAAITYDPSLFEAYNLRYELDSGDQLRLNWDHEKMTELDPDRTAEYDRLVADQQARLEIMREAQAAQYAQAQAQAEQNANQAAQYAAAQAAQDQLEQAAHFAQAQAARNAANPSW